MGQSQISMGQQVSDQMKITPDGRISRTNAAQYLGVAYITLAQWESAGRFGLHPIKFGGRVFYDFEQIKKIASGLVNDDGSLREELAHDG